MVTTLLPLLWRSSGPHQLGSMGSMTRVFGWVAPESFRTKAPAFCGDCAVTQRLGSVVLTGRVPLSVRRTVRVGLRMAVELAVGLSDCCQMPGQSHPPIIL